VQGLGIWDGRKDDSYYNLFPKLKALAPALDAAVAAAVAGKSVILGEGIPIVSRFMATTLSPLPLAPNVVTID
jgi:hypothetical protein